MGEVGRALFPVIARRRGNIGGAGPAPGGRNDVSARVGDVGGEIGTSVLVGRFAWRRSLVPKLRM